MARFVYADNAATTPVSPTVFEAMKPFYTDLYGNPSSLYAIGRDAKKHLELARADVASCLGVEPHEIFLRLAAVNLTTGQLKALPINWPKRARNTSSPQNLNIMLYCIHVRLWNKRGSLSPT